MRQQNLCLVQTKSICRRQFQRVQFFVYWVENIVGKGENAGYHNVLKCIFPNDVKGQHGGITGYHKISTSNDPKAGFWKTL